MSINHSPFKDDLIPQKLFKRERSSALEKVVQLRLQTSKQRIVTREDKILTIKY